MANWPEYDAALIRRRSLTMRVTEEAVAAGHAPANVITQPLRLGRVADLGRK